MKRTTFILMGLVFVAAMLLLSVVCTQSSGGLTPDQQIERGAYLVNASGCNDCHSPKIITERGPEPDPMRLLSGHPEKEPAAKIPAGVITPTGWVALTNFHLSAWAGPWGISYAANLTPDDLTGIGAWTEEVFIKAMRTGRHMGSGRAILPPMPWQNYGKMNDADLKAIFAYLKSLRPVRNAVPQPISPAAH